MNIKNKFSMKHLIFIGLILVGIFFYLYRFSFKEGQTSGPEDECDPIANIQEKPNDVQMGSLIVDHVSNSISTLDSYLPQLKAIQDKFRNISSCLSIGTVDISSANSIPVVIIDDPEPGTIKQKINYILPQGQKGEQGMNGPYQGASGVWGKKGANGTRGPVGKNVVPNNIYNKVY